MAPDRMRSGAGRARRFGMDERQKAGRYRSGGFRALRCGKRTSDLPSHEWQPPTSCRHSVRLASPLDQGELNLLAHWSSVALCQRCMGLLLTVVSPVGAPAIAWTIIVGSGTDWDQPIYDAPSSVLASARLSVSSSTASGRGPRRLWRHPRGARRLPGASCWRRQVSAPWN